MTEKRIETGGSRSRKRGKERTRRIQEKYPEVGAAPERVVGAWCLLYEEIEIILSDEATACWDLEQVIERFNELGIEIVTYLTGQRAGAVRWKPMRPKRPWSRRRRRTTRGARTCGRWARSSSSTARARCASPSEIRARARRRSTRRRPATRRRRRDPEALENAGRDSRIVNEPVNTAEEEDEEPEERLDDRATRKIENILNSFRKIGALDKDIKRMKFKSRTHQEGHEDPRAHRGLDRPEDREMAKLIRAADFTPAV